jgi:ferredoxin-NADP reductase
MPNLASTAADPWGINKPQRGAHFPIRAPAGELSGQGPQVDLVFLAEGVGAYPVLLVVMKAAQADPEDVVRLLTLGSIPG